MPPLRVTCRTHTGAALAQHAHGAPFARRLLRYDDFAICLSYYLLPISVSRLPPMSFGRDERLMHARCAIGLLRLPLLKRLRRLAAHACSRRVYDIL